MSINPGTRIGPYEITSPLGEGGMGVVYRAHDTKLGRDVAIKALPDAFANDSDRLHRFQREAQVLASLNHPNIAQIYGLEESDKTRCIVMELVEGETLQERLKRGAIPVDEALVIAKQIAEALEAAHEKGIIHRDLKPGNIKQTPDGKVKVLDFGLAKAMENAPSNAMLSNSPTLINSMAATNGGMIIGTASYMSPEQARGRSADVRSDVFAFGCVLYEMLTARQAFGGVDVSDILASVIKSEPDFAALPSNLSPQVQKLLRRCLEKDARRRWHAAGDLRIEIENVLVNPTTEQTQTTAARGVIRNTKREWAMAVIAGILAVALVVALWASWRGAPSPSPAALLRINGELGTDVSLAANVGPNSALALSSDGSTLAFAGVKNGTTEIYLRRLGQLQASPLAGTSGAQSPFFSPDGQWLAFFADDKLKKISVAGGAAVTLADAPTPRGGSWGDDNNIVFSPNNTAGISLQRVSSAGGKVESVTKLAQGEATHRWPQVLPGAKAVLYVSSPSTGAYNDATIAVQPLPSGTPKVLISGGYHAQYVASGHILYIHDSTLFAAPFDLNRLELTGQAVPAVEGVNAQPTNAAAQFAVSQTGALTYLAGQGVGSESPVVWLSRDGKTAPLRPMPSDWSNPHFSPDGRKLALDIVNGSNLDVWVYEWMRDTLTRLTFDPGDDRKPVWTPDGQRIAFASNRAKGPLNLYWQRADGGEVQRLTESSNAQFPASFHPSGKYLAFDETTAHNANDLVVLPIEGDEKSGWKPGKPSVFLSTPANEIEPVFSPDGRWVAYISNESGRNDVFVRPFPGPGGKWQISTAGGDAPTWSQTHRELLYRAPDSRIMVVSYTADRDSFKADKPRLWSEQPILPRPRQRPSDLHPDGERLAVSVPSGQVEEKLNHVTFIFNFFDELRRIAPPSKK
jgi:serine/threonine-protein kinase